MPASMISAEAGGRPNVNGSSIATVVSGEMPGSTPTSVPIITPAKQNRRFCHVAAVASPSARLSNSSTLGPLAPASCPGQPGHDGGWLRPQLERQAEALHEQQRRECRDDQAEYDERKPAHRRRGRAGHEDRPHAGRDQAEFRKQHCEQRDRAEDRGKRPPRRHRNGRVRLEQTGDGKRDAEGQEDPGQCARDETGAHVRGGPGREGAAGAERHQCQHDQECPEGKVLEIDPRQCFLAWSHFYGKPVPTFPENAPTQTHCTLMPASLMTVAKLAVLASIHFARSADGPALTSPPRLSIRLAMSGMARILLSSALRRCCTGSGVPAVVSRPCQEPTSAGATLSSLKLASSLMLSTRLSPDTASPRNCPCATNDAVAVAPLRITWLSPATVPLMASAPPRYGTCLKVTPQFFSSCTAEM